jgi:predicted nucleotidyltransferase
MTVTDLELPPHVTNLVRSIVERFHPERVILFGSHATGTTHAESDVDLLVVMDTELSSFKQAAKIYHALDHWTPVDIFVRTPKELVHRNRKDLILRTILDEGVTVYEARN